MCFERRRGFEDALKGGWDLRLSKFSEIAYPTFKKCEFTRIVIAS